MIATEELFIVVSDHPRFGRRTLGRYVSEKGAAVKAERLSRLASKLDAETVYSYEPVVN